MKNICLLLLLLCSSLCLTAQTSDPLDGLTINVIGDSYVANHRCPKTETWHYKLAQKHNAKYNNYGRNGGSVAWDRSKRGFGRALWDRCLDMADSADVVIVIAGHNDADLASDNADSLRIFTYRLAVMCQRLADKYPNAKIGFVTPWHLEKAGFEEVISIIHEVCSHFGYPVLDTQTGPVRVEDAEFRKMYFQRETDKAHLNNAGHDLVLPWAEDFVIKLVTSDQKRVMPMTRE